MVPEVKIWFSRFGNFIFLECFKVVLRVFQGSFKGVLRVFRVCVLRVFHGSVKGVLRVSRMFQGHVYLWVINHPRKCN